MRNQTCQHGGGDKTPVLGHKREAAPEAEHAASGRGDRPDCRPRDGDTHFGVRRAGAFRAPFSLSGRRHFGAERRRALLRHHDQQRCCFLLPLLFRPSQLRRTSRRFTQVHRVRCRAQKQQSAKDQAVGAWESIQQWAASSGQTLPPPTLYQRAQSILQRKPLVQVQVCYSTPPSLVCPFGIPPDPFGTRMALPLLDDPFAIIADGGPVRAHPAGGRRAAGERPRHGSRQGEGFVSLPPVRFCANDMCPRSAHELCA